MRLEISGPALLEISRATQSGCPSGVTPKTKTMSIEAFVTSLQSNLEASDCNAYVVPGEFSHHIFRCHLWLTLKQAEGSSCLVDTANKIINLCSGNASFDNQKSPLFLIAEGDENTWEIKIIDSNDETFSVATLSPQKRKVTASVTHFKRMLDVIRIITETFHHYYPQEVGSKRGRPDDDKCAGKRKRQRTEEEDEDEEVEEEEEFEGCYVLEGEGDSYEVEPLFDEL